MQAPAPAPKLNAALARQFAWLLRKDLRSIYTSAEDPGFTEWWLIKGRQEYPGWAHAVPEDTLEQLFAPAGQAVVAGLTVTVPQIVSTLVKYRPDTVRELSPQGQLDTEKFFAWAMARGLSEHKLAQHAPRSLLLMLDQPVALTSAGPQTSNPSTELATANPSSANSSSTAPPAVSFLMYLLWRLLDANAQQARNIHTPEGRKAFMNWFFSVAPQLDLSPLIAGRWLSWLKSPEAIQSLGPQAPSLAAQLSPKPQTPAFTGTSTQDRPTTPKPFGLNIYGFAYGELGIGEDLRMAVECCEAAGIPFHIVNIDAGDIRQADLHLKGKVSDSKELPPYNTNLFCLPAFDTVSRIFMQKGAAVFEGYRNIGWWPWELAVFPKAWKPYAFELVDEVWASSQFLYDMYKNATDKPVKLVPLAVSVARMKPYPRKHYGLPEKKFLFLFIFDFNSSVARKNPMATVRAFKQAFKPTDNTVGLVFKTMNTKPNNPEWQAFLKECQADKRIQLIIETMDRPEVLGLINACDAYVSLHRAEGFGRTLAEAMLLGKPVIATNYSGNVDYMSPEISFAALHELDTISTGSYQWIDSEDGSLWAEVNSADAIKQLQRARAATINISENIKIFGRNQFDAKVISRQLSNALYIQQI